MEKISTVFKDRVKSYYTCCIYLSEMAFGWTQGMLGPSLLDFKDRTGVSFSLSATYMAASDAGEMFGSITAAILHFKLNSFALISVVSFVMSISLIVLPFCKEYTEFLAVMTCVGFCRGFQTTFTISELSAVWRSEGQIIMTVLFLLRKVGAVISVFVIAPFLSSDDEFSDISSNSTKHYAQSNLHLPFTIFAVLVFATALLFAVFLAFDMCGKVRKLYSVTIIIDTATRSSSRSGKYSIYCLIFFISMAQYMVTNGGLEFLASFVVQQYRTSRREAAYVTAIYMGCAVVGRVILLTLLSRYNHGYIYLTNSLVVTASCVALYIFSLYNVEIVVICISIALISLAIHPNNPLLFIIIEESFFPVSSAVTNVVIVSGSLGSIINSLLKGPLMDTYGAILFAVLLLGESVTAFVLNSLFICCENAVSREDAVEGSDKKALITNELNMKNFQSIE